MFDWKLIKKIKEIGNDETKKIEVSEMPVFGCDFVIGYYKNNQEETILTVGIRKDNNIYITKILKGEEAEELYRRLVGVMSNTVNILGTEYKFFYDDLNNPELAESDGICKLLDKQIIVRDKQYQSGDSDKAKQIRLEHVIRHEVIHAVAEECGVQYGNNEDLVDWIAHIIPIVNKALNDIENMEKRTESSLAVRLGL